MRHNCSHGEIDETIMNPELLHHCREHLEHAVKLGVRVHAVEGVLKDLLLAIDVRAVLLAEHQSFQEGSLFGHAYYLLLRRLRG